MAEAEQDKRATRRFALRLPVSVSYTEDGVREKNAQTRDVSARGICFFVDSAITAGSSSGTARSTARNTACLLYTSRCV